jgi:hypothetical protein
MIPDLSCMVDQLQMANLIVTCGNRVKVRAERRLGVHHDRFVPRKPNQQIRSEPPFVGRHCLLLIEVATVKHSSDFDDPF